MGRARRVAGNYLDEVPVRAKNRPWIEDENGRIVIDVENKGLANKIAQTFFKKPRVSHISLDAYGTVVWKHMDGVRTVGQIVDVMKQHFPGEEERMLDRVVTFLATLQTHKFIDMKRERS